MAVGALFSFSFVLRLIYYASTRFSVLPFGDPYAAYGTVLSTIQSSHVIVPTVSDYSFLPLDYMISYSQWPGFQLMSAQLAQITGTNAFNVAMFLPLVLFAPLFIMSYALIKRLTNSIKDSLPKLPLLCLALVICNPFFEIPPLFKYDFAAILLIIPSILVLSYLLENWTTSGYFTVLLLSAGLTITHSYTSVLWVIFVSVLVIIGYTNRRFRFMAKILRGYLLERDQLTHTRMRNLLIVILIMSLAWWSFVGIEVWGAGRYLVEEVGIIYSILMSSTGVSPFASSGLTILTPGWILWILQIRNVVLLLLLVLGTIALFIIRSKDSAGGRLKLMLLVTAVVTVFATLSFYSGGNIGPYAYPSRILAPLLGVISVLPFVLLVRKRKTLARTLLVCVIGLLMFAAALGFWGNSYAPVYLYNGQVSPSSFGEHPLIYSAVSHFTQYLSHPTCILTNEEFVTSLSIPFNYWPITHGLWSANANPGCIEIIYPSINASSSYITEIPIGQSFNMSAYYEGMTNKSDLILSASPEVQTNVQIYYVY
jgi:hypothetical protein